MSTVVHSVMLTDVLEKLFGLLVDVGKVALHSKSIKVMVTRTNISPVVKLKA